MLKSTDADFREKLDDQVMKDAVLLRSLFEVIYYRNHAPDQCHVDNALAFRTLTRQRVTGSRSGKNQKNPRWPAGPRSNHILLEKAMIRFIVVRLLGAIVGVVSVAGRSSFSRSSTLCCVSRLLLLHQAKYLLPSRFHQMKALMIHASGYIPSLRAVLAFPVRHPLRPEPVLMGFSTPIQCSAPCFGYSFRQHQLVRRL
jgi:hypothetical protein